VEVEVSLAGVGGRFRSGRLQVTVLLQGALNAVVAQCSTRYACRRVVPPLLLGSLRNYRLLTERLKSLVTLQRRARL
jgi:hypothetical protein